MRLIDAEYLLNRIKEGYYCDDLGQNVKSIGEKEVNEAPIVEAIPINWIKNKIDQCETERSGLLSKMWEIHGDKKVYIGPLSVKDTCRTHELRFKTYYYNDLLEQWEKEHETNRCR